MTSLPRSTDPSRQTPSDEDPTGASRREVTPELRAYSFRSVDLQDAVAIRDLAREAGNLEVNSLYCYLLLCRDFSATCLTAWEASKLVGFVLGYRPPSQPDCLFVWQVGVAAAARRQRLGSRMLTQLVQRLQPQGVQYLEATVAPSNVASQRLFEGFARRLQVPCESLAGFTEELFGGDEHEGEPRYRIGPFDRTPRLDSLQDPLQDPQST